ncbi:MAG: 2-isopropylmalate synthase, partial [Cyclobacteriaceae bacterium]|nr:2-isopropylmalate synthase [Cyclobacteriaceae bacterium]
LKSMATLRIQINGDIYQETASGDGQYNAFMTALWRIYDRLEKAHPILKDYNVTIPPGGKTDALVECAITWEFKGKTLNTRGLDSDQAIAAIKGTIRMLNIIETIK